MPLELALSDTARGLRTGTTGDTLLTADVPPCDSLSPSLRVWTPGAPAACEMKFLLDESQAQEVELRLRGCLSPDPHRDPALGNAYRISTLYCDTPQRDVFYRRGRHQRRKYRVRRYGDESWVFLERKHKRGHHVRKRRIRFPLTELAQLSDHSLAAEGEGAWFREQIARHVLQPVCVVEYLRTAYAGNDDAGPLRLTFDRQLRGELTNAWQLATTMSTQPLLDGPVICEFKFRGAIPAAFKNVIYDMLLVTCGVSKYRHAMRELNALAEGAVHA